jgi:hypothetical protein
MDKWNAAGIENLKFEEHTDARDRIEGDWSNVHMVFVEAKSA